MACEKGDIQRIENDVRPLSAFAENNKIPGNDILEINRLQYLVRMKELFNRFGIRQAEQIAIAMGLSEEDVKKMKFMEQGEQTK